MNKTLLLSTLTASFAIFALTGCAGSSYNGFNQYENQSSYDRQMDYEAHKDVAEASKMLSAQDIQNIQHLKQQ